MPEIIGSQVTATQTFRVREKKNKQTNKQQQQQQSQVLFSTKF